MYFHPAGGGPVNGNRYRFRLRAANTHGGGPMDQEYRCHAAGPRGAGGAGRARDAERWRRQSLTTWDDPQDPSITGYQRRDTFEREWEDIPGTDATTTGATWTCSFAHATSRSERSMPTAWDRGRATTVVLSPAPARPTGLRAAPGNGRVTLTWDDPGPGVYIQSWRYTADGGATWTDIPGSATTLEGHLTRYTVTGLTNGQAYTFAVLADERQGRQRRLRAGHRHPAGRRRRASPPASPPRPGIAEATLTWDDPQDPGITRYQVQQDAAAWADIPGSGGNDHPAYGVGPRQQQVVHLPHPRAERLRRRQHRRPGSALGRRQRHRGGACRRPDRPGGRAGDTPR